MTLINSVGLPQSHQPTRITTNINQPTYFCTLKYSEYVEFQYIKHISTSISMVGRLDMIVTGIKHHWNPNGWAIQTFTAMVAALALFRGKGHGCFGGGGGMEWLLQRCQLLNKRQKKYPWLFHWPLDIECEPTTFHNSCCNASRWCKPLGPRDSGLTATCVLGLEDKLMNPKGNDRRNRMTNKTLTLKNCEICHTLSFPTVVAQLHIVFFHLCRANAPVRKANMNVSLPTPWRLK